MAAAALAPPAIMQGVEDAREEIHEFFANDPILRIANGLLKIGVAIAAIGIIATYSAPSFQKAATNERHDMQDALGLARTDPPGTPTPPPAPYVIQIAAIVAAVNALDPADATLNLQLSQQAAAAAKAMLAAYPNAPQHTFDDMTLLSEYCNDLVFDFSQSPPLWSAALNTYVPGIESSVNAVESDFGLAQTYDTNEVPAATSGSVNSPWGIVVTDAEQYAEGLLFGGVAGAIVNVATNGGLLSGVEQGLSALGGAVESAAGDVGAGLQTLAAGIENFPRVIADSVGFVFNWTMGQLLGWIGPILAWVGVAMAIAGGILLFVYQNIWPKAEARFKLAANARMARVWNWVDTKLKTRKKITAVNKAAATEVAIETANERAAPTVISEPIVASPPTLAAGAAADKPAEGGGAVNPTPSTPEPAPPTPGAVEPTATAPLPPQETQVVVEKGGVNVQAPVEPPAGVMTEAEATQYLGDRPNRAPTPEELREMADEAERERRKTRKPEKTDEPNREQLMELAAA